VKATTFCDLCDRFIRTLTEEPQKAGMVEAEESQVIR